MKIAKVEAHAIQAQRPPANPAAIAAARPEYPTPQRHLYLRSATIDTVIVKLTMEDGRTGFGEAKATVAPRVAKAIVEDLLAGIVMGQDPRDHSVLWERMYAGMRVRGHRAGFYLEAMSGVDIALWDLSGQIAGAPIHRMLGGGFRNPVRVYASGGIAAIPHSAPTAAFEQLSAAADSIRLRGFTGLKITLGLGLKSDLRSLRTLRDSLGPDFLIYADAVGAYDRAQALRLGRELEELNVGWLEMPIFPEDVEGYVQLAHALDIPIALDSLTSRFEARELIRLGGIDIVQPDVSRAGGITECRRIAELADTFGLAFAPHASLGSAISYAARAHLASAMPNTIISEFWIGENPLGDAILETPLRLQDGFLETPSGPGLGIQVREDELFERVGRAGGI